LDPTFAVATSSGTVVAGYDGIHGSSSVTTTGTGCCNGGLAQFSGDIYDHFQILGSLPTGAQLEYTYGVDILSDAALDEPQNSYFDVFLNLNGNVCTNTTAGHYGDFSKTRTAFVGIGNGLSNLDLNYSTDLRGSGPTTVYLDAIAKVDSVTVVDSSGNPITGVQLYDASGYNYNSPLAPTPKPSTILLLSTGIAAVAGLAKRRLVARI